MSSWLPPLSVEVIRPEIEPLFPALILAKRLYGALVYAPVFQIGTTVTPDDVLQQALMKAQASRMSEPSLIEPDPWMGVPWSMPRMQRQGLAC